MTAMIGLEHILVTVPARLRIQDVFLTPLVALRHQMLVPNFRVAVCGICMPRDLLFLAMTISRARCQLGPVLGNRTVHGKLFVDDFAPVHFNGVFDQSHLCECAEGAARRRDID